MYVAPLGTSAQVMVDLGKTDGAVRELASPPDNRVGVPAADGGQVHSGMNAAGEYLRALPPEAEISPESEVLDEWAQPIRNRLVHAN